MTFFQSYTLRLCFLVFTLELPAQADFPCGFDVLHEKRLLHDPAYFQRTQQFEQFYLENTTQTHRKTHMAGADFILPLVVHIVHNDGAENITDAQVLQAIEHLNEAFANEGYYHYHLGVRTRIQFCLARRNPQDQPTSGIVRVKSPLTNLNMNTDDIHLKNLSRWNPMQYINIWLVREIVGAQGSGIAGYAYFPGAHGSAVDGLVCEARFVGASPVGSTVLVHEMGHYLGLYHTFHGGCTNHHCLTDGDRVCDTPPDASTVAVSPCTSFVNSCHTDAQSGFASDQPDMHINYMDYGNWNCYHAFTEGQRVRMEAAIVGSRNSLMASKACQEPCNVPFAVHFSASAGKVPAGTIVSFTNTSVNGQTWQWSVDGVPFSTEHSPTFLFSRVGRHEVRLTALGANPLCAGEFADTVEVFCPVIAQFDLSSQAFFTGKAIPLNAIATADATHHWYINGVLSSQERWWNWIPPAVGSYEICLQVSNEFCRVEHCRRVDVVCPVQASISLFHHQLQVGQAAPVASSSTNATHLSWTLNGSPHSTATGFHLMLPTAGVYTLCLTAGNGYCQDVSCKLLQVLPPPCPTPTCAEDCSNLKDDDGDGWVDCYDTADCSCNPVPDCRQTNFDTALSARLAWRSAQRNISAIAVPIVANLDPHTDNVPEIVVPHYVQTGTPSQFYIFRGDGSNSNNPDYLTVMGGFTSYPASVPCVADIDRDGKPEFILVCRDSRIRIYRNFRKNGGTASAMELWITSSFTVGHYNYHVYAADFNQDGITELYAGNEVYYFDFSNPALPTLQRMPVVNGHVGRTNSSYANTNASSVAYDLLTRADCGGDPDCDGLEIAAGAMIYSVDLHSNDGDGLQIKVQRNLNVMHHLTSNANTFKDGYTTVGDLNQDGVPEVVVAGGKGNRVGVYAWNASGFWALFPNQGSSTTGCGVPTIANVYDDRTQGFADDYPEIMMVNEFYFSCFNLQKAITDPNTPYWWRLTTSDQSGFTGAVSFDFNGDKLYEIVYRDETDLRILYGGPPPFPPGVDAERNWFKFPAFSVTADEYPIVADVDGDTQAEIVYTANTTLNANNGKPYDGYLFVLESDESLFSPWLSSRPIWNQYNYFVTNILDDLTVPTVQQFNHLEMPAAGAGKRPLNNFLFNFPLVDDHFEPFLPLPDAAIDLTHAHCLGDSFLVELTVCNRGAIPLHDTLPITFYTGGHLMVESATKLFTSWVALRKLAADSCQTFKLRVPSVAATLFAVLNDAGRSAKPLSSDTAFLLAECDFLNNWDSISFEHLSPRLDLGADIAMCQFSVMPLHAGPGFRTYLWSDGSTDSTLTAWQPGIYWVRVADHCHRVQTDTIVLHLDDAATVDLGFDRSFCHNQAEPFQLNAPGFSTYQWSPATGLSCTDCPNPVVTPPLSGTVSYSVLVRTANGCPAHDTIMVSVSDTALVVVQGSACPGESFIYGGRSVPAGEVHTFHLQTVAGCDSTLRIAVLPLPSHVTQTYLHICAGDTAYFFDEWHTSPGIFSRTLKNVWGCDSTHTVMLENYAPPTPSEEFRWLCLGDSVEIFGKIVREAGEYHYTYTNSNGCDSTHTVRLEWHPTPQPTLHVQQPDCHTPHGEITIQGLPPLSTWSLNGGTKQDIGIGTLTLPPGQHDLQFCNNYQCCSRQQVLVQNPPPKHLQRDTFRICEGESVEIFGKMEIRPGLYERRLQNRFGCDSLLQKFVVMVPAPTPQLELIHPNCRDTLGRVVLNNLSPAVRVSLDGGQFQYNNEWKHLRWGNHVLLLQHADCLFDLPFHLEQPTIPQVILPGDTLIEWGQSVEIRPKILPIQTYRFTWSPTAFLSCVHCPQPSATPSETTTFSLVITDSLGCSARDLMTIYVQSGTDIYAPNVFSPNGDVWNDRFTIFAAPDAIRQVSWLRIFDRWGNQVFERQHFPPNEEQYGWDGTFHGITLPPAVFAWQAMVELTNGKQLMLKGEVSLLR